MKLKFFIHTLAIIAVTLICSLPSSAKTARASGAKHTEYASVPCTPDSSYSHAIDLGKIYFDINLYRTQRRETFNRMAQQIDSLASAGDLLCVNIEGGASPDGPLSFNLGLARKRARYTADWLAANTAATPDKITLSSRVHSWKEAVDKSIELNCKAQGIGDNDINGRRRKAILWMDRHVFPEMRATHVTVIARNGERTEYVAYEEQPATPSPVEVPVAEEPLEIPEEVVEQEVVEIYQPATETWIRNLRVKTNLPAWGMLWMNVHAEIDLAPHFSFSLPIYYSFFNYFKRTVKFRTFGMQPELRWFPRSDNMGFFLGAHFGFFYYNTAFNGEYRYQDHDGTTPALGGGIAAGFRWKLGRGADSRWEMEASLGGGIYSLDYDLFRNVTNGMLVGRRKRTFYGIDQASLTLIYRFGVQRKNIKKGGLF